MINTQLYHSFSHLNVCEKMLNPSANGESSHVVVKYVEEYMDLVESLPLDLQRCVSHMREIDARYQGESSATALFVC